MIFEVEDGPALVERVADRVELQIVDARHVRAVTHLDVDREQIDRALDVFAEALG